MASGRGLASLIPNRRIQDPDDVEEVEEIDTMEEIGLAEDEQQGAGTEDSGDDTAVGVPVVEEDEDTPDESLAATENVTVDVQADGDELENEMYEPVADVPAEAAEDTITGGDEDVVEDEDIEEPLAALEEEAIADDEREAVENSAELEDDVLPEIEDTFDDFSQLNDDEAMPMPAKPLVTPLELDPEQDADLIDLARKAARRKEEVHQPKARLPEKKLTTQKQQAPVQKESPPAPAKAAEPTRAKADNQTEKFDQHEEQVQQVPIGDISINPLQPRRNFDPAEMAELKESIDQHGILQPLVVRRLGESTYELIAGERRLRAAKELKWSKVPAVVRRDVSGDQTRLVYALIENIQREGLDPIELALAYQSLHDDFGLSHEEIGKRVGKSRVSVTNDLRVLQLPAEVQRGLSEGKITPGHGRAILMIPDADKQVRFYKHLLDEGLTVRKAETRARRIQRTMGLNDPNRQRKRNRHPLAQKYTAPLGERYATNVNVQLNDEKNQFEVTFKAYSVKEFEELVGRLLGTRELPDYSKDDKLLED